MSDNKKDKDYPFRFYISEIRRIKYLFWTSVFTILFILFSFFAMIVSPLYAMIITLFVFLVFFAFIKLYRMSKVEDYYIDFSKFMEGKIKYNIGVSRWLDKIAVRVGGEYFVIEAKEENKDIFIDMITEYIYRSILVNGVPEFRTFANLNGYFTLDYGASDEFVLKLLLRKVENDYLFLYDKGVIDRDATLFEIITSLNNYWKSRKDMTFDKFTITLLIGLLDELTNIRMISNEYKNIGYMIDGIIIPESYRKVINLMEQST